MMTLRPDPSDNPLSSSTKKVYLVEDHPFVREMLGEAINEMPGLSVCGSARTGEEALEALGAAGAAPAADLVLVDLSLPQMSGADLVGAIGQRWPALPCVVFSGHQEAHYVERALAAGARGYILKGNPYELEDAIRAVLGGAVYLSAPLRER